MNSEVSVEEFYDDFASHQTQMGVNHRHLAIQRWLEEKGLKKNARVLEIGAGIGTQTELMLLFLNSEGYVIANDISNDSLEIAKDRLKAYSNVKLLHGDIINLEIEDSFDCIVLPDVLEHIPSENHHKLFEKLFKFIKDDGFIFIHIPNPDYLNWVRKNYPEQLQIIDQSLSTDWVNSCAEKAGLYLSFMQSYSIYQVPEDYRMFIIKKDEILTTRVIQ